MLIFFKTKPLVEAHWPGREIQPSSVLTDQLWGELCGDAVTLEQCSALWEILRLWAQLGLQSGWVVGLLEAVARLPDLSAPSISPLLVAILQSPDTVLPPDTLLASSQVR